MIKRNSGQTLTLDEDYKHIAERAIIIAALPYKSFAGFARKLGVTRQAIRHWLSTKEVAKTSLKKVSELSGLSSMLLNPKMYLMLKDYTEDDWLEAIENSDITQEEREYLNSVKKFPSLTDYRKKK